MVEPIKKLLNEKLKLPKNERSLLPSSYHKIGDIVIINIKKPLWKYDKKIGKVILENIPNTRTVCKRTDFITGKLREPNVKVIAGKKNTETIHKEHGIEYKLDVAKVMFSKGNLTERKRLIDQVSEGETIVDMFAGIGYFSLGIAKFSEVKKIYSIELNPESYHYLWENIKLNQVTDKIVPMFGDCRKECESLSEMGRIADRILMGLLPTPKDYLDSAMKIIKNGGVIHYHSTLGKEEDYKKLMMEISNVTLKYGMKVELINFKEVKSYAPNVNHVVLDVKINH
ncbi:MAG: class I SAM-dependent methyltransferase family protein [Candidatus Aenigmarchaeota archaeon]|nr:class I SAM-dependent methyltransferase family protein [Candidatus Aenigmarchaeota archaeon]